MNTQRPLFLKQKLIISRSNKKAHYKSLLYNFEIALSAIKYWSWIELVTLNSIVQRKKMGPYQSSGSSLFLYAMMMPPLSSYVVVQW